MRRLSIILFGLAVLGCGNSPRQLIDLAAARQTCAAQGGDWGDPDGIEVFLSTIDALRDEGVSRADIYFEILYPFCTTEMPSGEQVGCLACLTALADAVYGQ